MILKKRYNIMLNPNLVETIDVFCKSYSISRSHFINDAICEYLKILEDLQ